MRSITAAAAILAAGWLAGSALAGEDDGREAARGAWTAAKEAAGRYDEALKAYQAAVARIRSAGEEATDEDRDAQKKAQAAFMEVRAARSQADAAFREAFAKTVWESWNSEADAEILEAGLWAVLNEAAGEGEVETALRAGKMHLSRFPDGDKARGAIPFTMLRALSRSPDLGKAMEEAAAVAARAVEPPHSGYAAMLLGDMKCAVGRTEEAAKDYAALLASIPEDTTDGGLKGVRRYAALRAELVGKDAPEVDAATWVGGEAKPLSALRGRVVALDFWATWCGPCRAVMPAIDELYRENRDRGFTVVGLTRYYANGYLPEAGDKQAESVRNIPEDGFVAHLEEYRARTGITYPFAVGTQADFESYRVSGIPTMVVVDPAGKVAIALVGSGSEGLLKATVERLLSGAKPAGTGSAGPRSQ